MGIIPIEEERWLKYWSLICQIWRNNYSPIKNTMFDDLPDYGVKYNDYLAKTI